MPNSNTKSPMKDVVLITSGDLRLSANQVCWAAQEDLERKLTQCFKDAGVSVRRAFPVDAQSGHGFISSQRMGMDIFANIDPEANLVFATAAWQYSHHVLPGMRSPSRPDPHGRELVRTMAGTCRAAESEWIDRQSWRTFQYSVEQGFHRRVFSDSPERMDRPQNRHP